MLIAIVRVPRPADAEAATAMERRFAENLALVEQAPGFRGFELLRPLDGGDTYLSISRWTDRAAFEAWASSAANAQAHGRPPAAGHAAAPGSGGSPGGAHPGTDVRRPGVELYEIGEA